MLFSQKEFEHKIEEKKLRKGLKLFLQNKVECTQKSSIGNFNFLILDQRPTELLLQKKGEKILNYTCSCPDKNFCEHLAAVLFYLQKEIFVFEKKQKNNQDKKFKRNKNEFEIYFKEIKEIVKPFLALDKLTEKNNNEINKNLVFEKNKASAFGNELYFDLAVILQISQLINFNSQQENSLTSIVKNSTTNLEIAYGKGLSAREKVAWLLASENSLRSQSYFRTGVFYFLIQKAVSFLKEKKDAEKLLSLLKKRKEAKNNLSPISKKLIVEIQLSILLAALSQKKYANRKWESTIELPIALSELEFSKKNTSKGFKILEEYGILLKNKNVNRYLDLVEHILIKAKEKNKTDLVKNYLQEKFIYGYYIDKNDLEHYFNLILAANASSETTALIQEIKTNSVFYTFDKIADILLHQNRLDELIHEIRKEKNKFSLLNKIAIRNLSKQDESFFQLYTKHLAQAVTEAKFPYFQEEVFNKAKNYLDLLHPETRKKLLENLKEKLMYNRTILVYIDKIYP